MRSRALGSLNGIKLSTLIRWLASDEEKSFRGRISVSGDNGSTGLNMAGRHRLWVKLMKHGDKPEKFRCLRVCLHLICVWRTCPLESCALIIYLLWVCFFFFQQYVYYFLIRTNKKYSTSTTACSLSCFCYVLIVIMYIYLLVRGIAHLCPPKILFSFKFPEATLDILATQNVANAAISREIGLLLLPDTWMIPQDQNGDMLWVFFQPVWAQFCHRLPFFWHWVEFFPFTKAYVIYKMSPHSSTVSRKWVKLKF